jgi:hypothetical protein
MIRKTFYVAVMAAVPLAAFLIFINFFAYSGMGRAGMSVEGTPVTVYDPEIGFVPNPNARSRLTYFSSGLSYDVFNDDRGARVAKPRKRSASHVDILTIGCSFSWGHGFGGGDTYSMKVGEALGVPASNLSFASFGTVQSLLMLRRNRDLTPKLVVYGVIADHFRRNVVPCVPNMYPFCLDQSYVSDGRIEPPISNGVRRVALQVESESRPLDPLTWVAHNVDVAFGRITMKMNDAPTHDVAKQVAAFQFLMREMASTVESMGAKLLVVFIPTYYEPPPPELVKTITDLNLPFIDMTESFRAAKESVPYLPNDGHPSVAGHALIAKAIVAQHRLGLK